MSLTQPGNLHISAARKIVLRAQGLHQQSFFGKGQSGALTAVKHLGYIQLDTLSVVARAHHHTLWTRSSHYNENHLDQLVKKREVFEYWSHAASYLPINDFRFSLVRKGIYRKGHAHWFAKDKRIMRYVLDRIQEEGALPARAFETDRPRGTWFDWKPAKIALEQLFMDGTLMVSHRVGFQKVYDLTERILPASISTQMPTQDEYADYLILGYLQANGLGTPAQMAYLRKGMLSVVQRRVKQLQRDGRLMQIAIEGLKDPYYLFPDVLNAMKQQTMNALHLLSPFDNLLIQRARIRQLFGYDYQVECYVPEAKRKYGYFCLPILWKDSFVGRIDPKADRGTGIFYIKALHIEHSPSDLTAFFRLLRKQLNQFAAFNHCDEVQLSKAIALKWRRLLEK